LVNFVITERSADFITPRYDVSGVPKQYIRRHSREVSPTYQSLKDPFISMSTTGKMEEKLFTALSLLLVAGKLTGEQNQKGFYSTMLVPKM